MHLLGRRAFFYLGTILLLHLQKLKIVQLYHLIHRSYSYRAGYLFSPGPNQGLHITLVFIVSIHPFNIEQYLCCFLFPSMTLFWRIHVNFLWNIPHYGCLIVFSWFLLACFFITCISHKLEITSRVVVLNGGDFAPRGHLAMSGDVFGFHNWGCFWHLVYRGQGCGEIFYNTQDTSQNEELAGPKCQ